MRRALLAICLLLGTLVLAPSTASADVPPDLPYTSCWWNRTSIPVFVPPGMFPRAVYRGNGWNSFEERIDDAVHQWNRGFSKIGDGRRLHVVRRWRRSGEAGIQIRYLDSVSGGIARVPQIGGCGFKDAGDDHFFRVDLQIERFERYFTQNASRRATWERCDDPPQTFASKSEYKAFHSQESYICGKSLDFASLVAHELGHALGLAHPDDSDGEVRMGSQFRAANCVAKLPDGKAEPWWNLSQATICPLMGGWKTDQRILDSFDIDTLRVQYRWFGRGRGYVA